MSNPRLQNTFFKEQSHTKETIFAKLNTNLTDAERKSFIKILLDSTNTLNLLAEVALDWEKIFISQQEQIETLKEKIRIKNICIDTYKQYPMFSALKKAEVLQENLENDISTLKNIELAKELSLSYAKKSLAFLGTMLNNVTQDINNILKNKY